MPDNNGVQYTNPPQSRNEELLEDIITDQPYTAPPQSEIEEILVSIIDDTPYTKPPQSRNADLLLQVKEVIEQGGGGSRNYTIQGLQNYIITPVNPQDVTDAYKGTSYDDKVLANCPSLSTFYSTFYDKFLEENLAEPLENYEVRKQSLGKDQSETYDLYEYDFIPAKWDRLILLTAGMHAYEVASIFGLAYLMGSIIENHEGDELLTYLYEHVRIKVIPIINPWGYSQSPKSYVQSRGVNINRNFDYNGEWEAYNPGSNPNNAKGSAPFSEAETQILQHWASDNYGAEFWIDCHTSVGVTANKEIFTSTISNTPLFDEVTAAHEKLEAWTKAYYHLNSLNVEYRVDSSGAGKGRWYTGVYNKTCLVIEQSSECASIGNVYNGDRNSIVNYTAQIYAYIGEFLLRANETVNATEYIEELQQEAIENKKYLEPKDESEPTPEPITLYVSQGTLKSSDGTPTPDNLTRVYTADVPITHSEFHVLGFGSGYWFGGRFYDSSDNFEGVLAESTGDNLIGFKNSAEHSTSWGIASDVTIVRGSQKANATKMKLIIRTELGSDNLAPSDVANKEITVDGVTYVLQPAIEPPPTPTPTPLTVHQGTLKSTDGTPTTDNLTRVYTADVPITHSEFHVLGFGSGYWFGGRFYDNNGNYVTNLGETTGASKIGFKNSNEHSTSWGNVSDVTIVIGSNYTATATKMKLIIRTELGSDNLAPSDVANKEITVDGVTYTLQPAT